MHKIVYAISKAIENLSGYQSSKRMNLCQYTASNVPSLKGYCEQSTHQQNGVFLLKALSSVMFSLQGYEFKTNHEEWIESVKPQLGCSVFDSVSAATGAAYDNIKTLYKVKNEMRGAFQSLLKLAAHLEMLGRAAYEPQIKKRTYIGMDLQFQVEDVDAFVRQPDGSIFSWCERFQYYYHLIYGIFFIVVGLIVFRFRAPKGLTVTMIYLHQGRGSVLGHVMALATLRHLRLTHQLIIQRNLMDMKLTCPLLEQLHYAWADLK